MIGLLAATSWVDVAIPLIGGLLFCCCPQFAMKKTGDADKDASRQALARKGGFILLLVAGIYYVTTTFGSAA